MSRSIRSLLSAAVLTAVLALDAIAGGIQMAAEKPEAPFLRTTTGTVLYVNTFECGRARDFKLEASAEGLVNGKRVSLPLKLEKTLKEGRFPVTRQWPLEGDWVLIFTTQAHGQAASLVVRLEGNGGFVADPESKDGAGFVEVRSWDLVYQKPTGRDIEALLAGRSLTDRSEVRKASLVDRLAQALGL
jgi:hypothetical protein